MRKQAGQSAPDQRWSADRQPKCRVEDISSDSNYSPETVTGGVFQFSITKIRVKRNLFKVLPTKISLQWAVVAAQPPLMEGKQDGRFPSAGFQANRHSWESKQISFHQLDREGDLDRLSDNEVNIGEPFRVWRDTAVCWSGGEDLIIIISLWKQPRVVDLRWKMRQC